MRLTSTIVRKVDFCDVDSTGAMWHGYYCKYYEDARGQLLKKLGISYKEIQAHNHQIPVIGLNIKYSKACRYDQELEITATITNFKHFLEFQYIIKDKNTGETMSTATTKHVFYDFTKQRTLINTPEFMKHQLTAGLKD